MYKISPGVILPPSTDASYAPIMLCAGWVLERYYGWSVVREETTLKVLRKSRGPVTTFLLVARGASEEEVADAVRRCGLLRKLSILVLNDFSSTSEEDSRIVAGVRFRRVTRGRWFGVGTFVFDLSESVDTLWSRIHPKERSECRKVEKLGLKVEFNTRPQDEEIRAFLALYYRMARERGLEKPRLDILQRMFAGGNLLMARCTDLRGRDLVFNLAYIQGDQGFGLYLARADGIPGGASRYTHWETIKRLKATGFRWYDLALVASRDRSDGIYWFKKSFGGAFVDSGREFQYVPWGIGAAYRIVRSLRNWLRRFQ